MDFTTSVFQDSTCRSETGSTASASPHRASLWSLCKDQIYCGENRRGPASGERKPHAHYKAQDSLELLDPGQHGLVFVVAQMHVVAVGMPGVEGVEADHVQALSNSRQREVAAGAAFLLPTYLLWDGALVELHHSVEIFCRHQHGGQGEQKVARKC